MPQEGDIKKEGGKEYYFINGQWQEVKYGPIRTTSPKSPLPEPAVKINIPEFKRPDPSTFRVSPLESQPPVTAGITGMEDQYRYRVNEALNRRLNNTNVPTYQYSNMEMPSVPRSAWDRAIERRKSNGSAMPPRGF